MDYPDVRVADRGYTLFFCGGIGGSYRGGARAKSENTGLTRSSITVIFLRHSAGDATSTKEGVTCLLHVTTATSPRSVLDSADELNELEVPFP